MRFEKFLPFGRPDFSDAELEAVARVMRSGWVGAGPETELFEAELAAHLGAPDVVALSSCTAALHLSMIANGVGAGDEVIVPSLTWCSSANAALYVGAVPVLCDVDGDTLCATPSTILPLVTDKTRAVVVVHFGGRAIDVEALRRALPERVRIIEDAAHAFGSRYGNGALVGTSGNLTCFSFYANKNLSTAEGGALVCADPELAARIRRLRAHGLPADAWHRFTKPTSSFYVAVDELGFKMNYTDMQAAMGRVQLRRQPTFDARRAVLARRYAELLAERMPAARLQAGSLGPEHSRHLLCVWLPEGAPPRDDVVKTLRRRNVGASIHYVPLHLSNLYAVRGPLPVTEATRTRLFTLPISASITPEEASQVADELFDVVRELSGSAR